jgi:hypothetical protein
LAKAKAAMAKNILILSDGTGQAGGIKFDEDRTNIYKLYRATRCGPDRIFLFGFSRGAYTVRCLAAVIAKCGIPRCMPNGKPLPLDVKGSRKLATYAVKEVYQFCSSKPRKAAGSYRNFTLDTRELIAARFRNEHGSCDENDSTKANV